MRARDVTRVVLSTLTLVFLAGGDVGAQTVRWNDRGLAVDTTDDAPKVQLWIDGQRSYSYGEPVRVWFNVSDDAYVVVARVDANGHLTVLYPASRTRSTEAKGGQDVEIRGRRGGATFYATDRMGGGFIFAVASYDPFDLSRLGMRDFDRYVTGTYVGRPTRVYIGDPHRVVTRFAAMVTYQEQTPFDYAVDYYNVDAPYYLSSVGFSNFCNGFNGMYRRGLQERWDDELFYGMGSGFASAANCANFNIMCGGLGYLNTPWGYDLMGWSGLGPLCFYPRGPQAGGPVPPVGTPVGDSLRVGPWLPDSIGGGGGRPDTVGVIPEGRTAGGVPPDALRRANTVTEGTRRPIVLADDPSDKSYSIPDRALRRSPATIGEGRDRGLDGSPRPGRDRLTPGAERDNGGIDWVRPPRQVTGDARSDLGEGRLPRNPRERGSNDASSGEARGGRPTFVSERGNRDMPPRYDPPSRTFGPRFDAPSPNVRSSFDSPRYDPVPARFDGPRFNGGSYSPPFGGSGSVGPSSHSGGQISAPASTASPVQTQAPVAPPASGSSSSGERKPGT
jgi:Domain of unknown function (DUF4384)